MINRLAVGLSTLSKTCRQYSSTSLVTRCTAGARFDGDFAAAAAVVIVVVLGSVVEK